MINRARRILVVCLGNICRSPTAAAILARHGAPGIEVRSAGIRDKHTGMPAHPAMIRAAALHGYDLTMHRAAQVTSDDLEWADTVLAMDRRNLADLARHPAAHTKALLYLGDRDVPDPWGRDDAAFADCVERIRGGAHRHLP
ncbi:low molecular weight protein-tyrosine-phosphatase [Streptomyces avicenniae]|uniref:low molecular weight protein-tyrosine-phosphatase n=1 Tax=Streptomyces avicenniae TaxID=500153 RepID=UPI0006992B41|nr:low molecular weight protein-tyrosine-phosphatase [Streptomyces avicenniae]